MKKKLFGTIIVIAVIGIVSMCQLLSSTIEKKEYTDELYSETKTEVVNDILDKVSFSDEIKDKIPAQTVYDEFSEIENQKYLSEIYSLMELANENLKNEGTTLVELWEKGLTLPEILTAYTNGQYSSFAVAYLIGDDENTEYNSDAEALYQRLLTKIEKDNYAEALDEMDQLLNTYKFVDKKNRKVANLYHDISLLYNIKTTGVVIDKQTLDTLYDPCACTIEAMKSFIDERYDMIDDKNSPFLYDSTIIQIEDIEYIEIMTDNEIYKDKLYKTIYNQYTETDDRSYRVINVAKIKFIVDEADDTFYSYVIMNEDRSCTIYSIKSEKNKDYTSLAVKREAVTNFN